MYTYVYVYIYIYIDHGWVRGERYPIRGHSTLHINKCVHTYAFIYTCVHTYIHLCVWVYIYINVYILQHVYECMAQFHHGCGEGEEISNPRSTNNIGIYTHMLVCRHVYTCIYMWVSCARSTRTPAACLWKRREVRLWLWQGGKDPFPVEHTPIIYVCVYTYAFM